MTCLVRNRLATAVNVACRQCIRCGLYSYRCRTYTNDVVRTYVRLSVCELVTVICLAKKRLYWSRCRWVADSDQWAKESCIRWRLRSPAARGNFGGFLSHWKALSLFCGASSRRDHPILNNDTTCDAAFVQILWQLVSFCRAQFLFYFRPPVTSFNNFFD